MRYRIAPLCLALVPWSMAAWAQPTVTAAEVLQCDDKSAAADRLECLRLLAARLRPPPAKELDIAPLIERSIEPSYVGLSSGIRLHGDESPHPLLYEAQIVKNVELLRKMEFGDTWRMKVDVPLRFVVRQFDVESKPVRTPTYNPGVRAYLYAKPAEDADKANVYSLGFFHYSNGQEGVPLETDGRVNTFNGSFSTNYAELSWMRMGLKPNKYHLDEWDWRLSFRQHFYGTWDAAQPKQYPRWHVRADGRVAKVLFQGWDSELRMGLTYRNGYGYRVWNAVTPESSIPLRMRDRIQFSMELITVPEKASDFGLYVRYDLGHDDYNIHFGKRMNRIMFGLAANL